MSICSNGTKKPKKKEKDQPKQMPTEGVEALVDGDVEKAEEVGVDPMAIPDYFNNIRNNYFVANRMELTTTCSRANHKKIKRLGNASKIKNLNVFPLVVDDRASGQTRALKRRRQIISLL